MTEIQEAFNKVITYSQGIAEPKTDMLFKLWEINKAHIRKQFGDRLTWESPEKVSFELGEKEKHARVAEFVYNVDVRWKNEDLAEFIELQEKGFFHNTTIEDYRAPDGKLIKKGTKLIRAFKHFVNDERSLNDIQNEASRIIQEDKIEGTLCLSVHPLDYLSMSENTYNWRSCHSLDGEYRAGNLSYMMDSHTIVCYLRSDEPAHLPNFPDDMTWNNKKWRVLLYISNDWNMIMAGRQYPFETQMGMDYIAKHIIPHMFVKNRFSNVEWTGWKNDYIDSFTFSTGEDIQINQLYLPIGGKLESLENLVKDADGSKQYNDILYSSTYIRPLYMFRYIDHSWNGNKLIDSMGGSDTRFNIGAYTYCLYCGKAEVINGSATMMCEDCEFKYGTSDNDIYTYCSCCGQRIYVDDACYVGDERVCGSCYDQHAFSCERCGMTYWNDEIIYCEETNEYLCKECYDEVKEE